MYKGIGPMFGTNVSEEDALDYALEACGVRQLVGDEENPKFKELLEVIKDWYFCMLFCHYEDDDPEVCPPAEDPDGPDPDEEYERYLDIDPDF